MAKAEAVFSKRKAICALLPYAIRLSGGGQQQMIGAFSRALRPLGTYIENFAWGGVEPFVVRLFDKPRRNWYDHKLSGGEHIFYVQLAQLKYRTGGRRKVPRWILRFVLHYLSQDPPPPTSVIISCLSIIAIDLDCTVPGTGPDERYVHVSQTFTFSDQEPAHGWRRFQAW